MAREEQFVELIRIADPIEADLFGAFLEDGEVDYEVINRSGAGMLSGLMPGSVNPVIFRILDVHLERGKQLLEEYRTLQNASVPPDDAVVTNDEAGTGDLSDVPADR
jgi:hypothetical protein